MDNKKNKFIIKNDITSSPGYWLMPNNNYENIPEKSRITKKEKITKGFDFNYNTLSMNTPSMNTPGRGFGNLNISNEIRNGDSSRQDTKEYRESREMMQMFDHQFSYLDRNFQDPNHIVMPIPRGGESTRSQNQLNIDTMRDSRLKNTNTKKIDFNY